LSGFCAADLSLLTFTYLESVACDPNKYLGFILRISAGQHMKNAQNIKFICFDILVLIKPVTFF